MANELLNRVKKIFVESNENEIYMSETVMLACEFSPSNVEIITQSGLQNIPAFIDEKEKYEELTDKKLINNLFALKQEDLEQLPISFYADIVKSEAFQNFSQDHQNEIFDKIFSVFGITEGLKSIEKVEADKIAYNYKDYKTILSAYFAVNKINAEEEQEANAKIDKVIKNKLQSVLDNAPELNADPKKRDNIVNLVGKCNGDYYKAADEVLDLFQDTKALKKEQLNAVGLGSSSEYYYPISNAKTVWAEYKLGAYAEAAKALDIIDEKHAENITLINPVDKDKPESKFITMAKNTMANFAKPQNIAKIATRTILTQGVNRAISHLTGAMFPCVGAAVGLAMKLGECGKRILKDKESAKEVFSQAMPDLARGVITVGLSVTPVKPLAGPIAAVAATVVRGMQAAHKEGLQVGNGFFKRVAAEFKKKSTWANLGISAVGAAIGYGVRTGMTHYHDLGNATEQAGLENNDVSLDETKISDTIQTTDDVPVRIIDEDGNLQEISNQAAAANTAMVESEPELSYVEQYLQEHPGAHLDKNGWVQNADGSYAKNENGQLFGGDDRVFRDLKADETLDQTGNIVKKALSTEQIVNEQSENENLVVDAETTQVEAETLNDAVINDAVIENDSEPISEKEDLTKLTDEELYARMDELANVDTSKMNLEEQKVLIEKRVEQLEELKNRQAESDARLAESEKTLKELTDEIARNQEEIDESQKNIEQLNEEIEKLDRLERLQAERDELQTKLDEVHARQNELGVLQEPVLTVRSAEELAQIDQLQAEANKALAFNSLPESQQRELIDLQAQMKVAENHGDMVAHENLKNEFNEKFNQYVAEDKELDRLSQYANIKGTQEYNQREEEEYMIKSNGTYWGGEKWTEAEREEAIKKFTEKYGDDMGNGKNGIRQYVRHDGNLKMEIPDVPAKNFLELGYQKQADGTWLYRDEFTTKIVTDVNHNGIPDAGDTYEKTVDIGKPGGAFYSKEHHVGKYVEPAREKINPNYNAKIALEERIKYFEEVMYASQSREQE